MDTNTMKLNMNERNMKFEEMKKELIEQARACRTREEKLAFIKKNYIELTEEQMVMINGGGSDTDCSSSPNHSHDWVYLHVSRPGSFFGEFWPDYLYECKHCGKQDWRWT